VAVNRDLEIYLRLERMMLELDKRQDPLAEGVRDLMDPIWRRLSPEDVARLDARGTIADAGLFPIQLPSPPDARLPPATVARQEFRDARDGVGWHSSDDWNDEVA
jgi:hypothetical protein